MRKPRIYVDTSVIGGCFDPEFAKDSFRMIEYARTGRVHLLVTDLVIEELQGAPSRVLDLYRSIPLRCLDLLPPSEDTIRLRDAYVKAGVVQPGSRNDAHHVAAATVAGADAIVSWNFKHIVQFGRMRAYNEVNARHGYGFLSILTPREVNHETA